VASATRFGPIAGTAINQTGQAIEGIAIIMAVYLTISLDLGAHELVRGLMSGSGKFCPPAG
jgi:ABC-type amino acid transport system permease subunit